MRSTTAFPSEGPLAKLLRDICALADPEQQSDIEMEVWQLHHHLEPEAGASSPVHFP